MASHTRDMASQTIPEKAVPSAAATGNAPTETRDESAGPVIPLAQLQAVEVDSENTNSDRDSAIDSGESSNSTSLASSILDYEYANGRRYHAYHKGSYLLPNDEEEQDRLDLLHHVCLLVLGGRLFVSPLPKPQRVLDVGTGTGIWATDVADQFPSAQVVGTDLSPIQPAWVPPNVQFYIDDLENEWLYDADDAFDLVHTRVMGGSISDWDRFISQAYTHLKPGGWLELHEPESWIMSDDDSKDRLEFTTQFQTECVRAAEKFGKDLNLAHTHKQRLIDSGFADVHDDVIKVDFLLFPRNVD